MMKSSWYLIYVYILKSITSVAVCVTQAQVYVDGRAHPDIIFPIWIFEEWHKNPVLVRHAALNMCNIHRPFLFFLLKGSAAFTENYLS